MRLLLLFYTSKYIYLLYNVGYRCYR